VSDEFPKVKLNIEPPPDPFDLRARSREIEDIISEALCEIPVADLKTRHVHVFRKEYEKCLIKGCGASRTHQN